MSAENWNSPSQQAYTIMKSARKGNVGWPRLSGCEPGLGGKRAVLSSHLCYKNIHSILQGNPKKQQEFTSS